MLGDDALWLFSDGAVSNTFRVAHVIAAIMWMGLLWFFNFVQVPAFAQMDAAARNNALDKLSWRALWWFRYAAAATVALGLLIILSFPDVYISKAFWKSGSGVTLLVAIIMATVMLYNVWMIIWPNQQIVIANARAVAAGGEANPDAAAAARKGAMASRQNTIFSFSVLWFMVGVSHIYTNSHWDFDPWPGKWLIFFIIAVAIIVVLEMNALGMISGTGNGGLNVIYETHVNALYAGGGLVLLYYILSEIILRA